jgi:hypothetical protein
VAGCVGTPGAGEGRSRVGDRVGGGLRWDSSRGTGRGGRTSSTERGMDYPCQIGTPRAYRGPRRVDPRSFFAVAPKRRPVGAGWG